VCLIVLVQSGINSRLGEPQIPVPIERIVAPDVKPGPAETANAPSALPLTAPAIGNVPPPVPPPAPPVANNAPLSTAQVVARCEPSVALVKGKVSSGTGFLIRHDLVATNAHVISHEFLSDLEVRFPSAPAGQQGPSRVDLVYEDERRDLAFLKISSDLPALEIALTYQFVKGEDVTVIGSPGLGDETVLENAISRGVMSARTVIDGMNYLQLSIAINPGNSGGPVFDSAGRVVGVATLKSNKAEAMGFCIPVEEVQSALTRLDSQPASTPALLTSRHRADLAFRLLTVAGALYTIGLENRASILQATTEIGPTTNLLPTEEIRKLDEILTMLDHKQFSLVDSQVAGLQADSALAEASRRAYRDLAANFHAMKNLYAHPSQPANAYASRVQYLKTHHLRVVKTLQNLLKMEVPAKLLAILESRPAVSQPPVTVVEIVPAPLQPRLLRGSPGQTPRGPIGTRGMGGINPATDARTRIQESRNRAQQRVQDLRNRTRGVQPPGGR
jgi:S1-C subfamily serine protease